MQRKGAHWFKAVDTSTGESVGFAGVVAPQSEESKWDGKLSETMDGEWFGVYIGAVGGKKEGLLGGREDVWCEFLCVFLLKTGCVFFCFFLLVADRVL